MKEFYVGRWNEGLEARQCLEWCDTEEQAWEASSKWCDVFPNAWVDVYSVPQDGEPDEDYTVS